MTEAEAQVIMVSTAYAVSVVQNPPGAPPGVQMLLFDGEMNPLSVIFMPVEQAREVAARLVATCLEVEANTPPLADEIRRKML